MSSPSIPQLIISNMHLQQIVEHARLGYPYEVCGLAGGRNGVVQSVVAVPNASLTPLTNFALERQAMVDVIIGFQRIGQEVVAIYHSHPGTEPIPSERDLAEATWPDAIYLIVGIGDPEQPHVRAWTLRNGQAEPADLQLIE